MGKGVIILTILVMVFSTVTCSQDELNPVSVQNAMQDFTQSLGSRINGGSFMPVFSHKGDTKGNRYLFDSWAHGVVISANNFVLDSSDYFFTYDKMTHHLFLTKDKKKVIEVRNEEFKSFTLIQENQNFVFVHVPLINQTDFFEELVNQPGKYSLYKLIHTRIRRADYRTNGLFETGNDYDEYVDNYDYYVIFPGDRVYKRILLKTKSIKDILSMEHSKIKSYFSDHWESNIDEAFLKGLILYIDQ
jgi:hypothetical protein